MEQIPELKMRKGLPTKLSLTQLLNYVGVQYFNLLYHNNSVGVSWSCSRAEQTESKIRVLQPLIERYGFKTTLEPARSESLLRGRLKTELVESPRKRNLAEDMEFSDRHTE